MDGTRKFVEKIIIPVKVEPDLKYYLGDSAADEQVSDLAD